MNVKRNKISRAIFRIIVVLICLSLALLSLPSIPAQGTKSYESQAQLSAGVLLNKPGISYDLSILEKMSKTDSVNINQILKTEHGMSSKIIEKNIYIYRSNFNENVSVLLFEITPSELSINDTEKSSISFSGLSVNIVIPTELVYENFDQVLSPTVPIDPETFAWGAALNYELTWLENRSIIK